jgi:predicted RNase H-like HicB family nuclease
MIYKLFIWKHGDGYIACFPEVDPGLISHGPDKEIIKEELIERIAKYLKTLTDLPKNQSIEDLYEILSVLPHESIVSLSGIQFDKNIQ